MPQDAPAWRRTRDDRYAARTFPARWNWPTPRLKQIALVEPEAIDVPAWALAKAVRGLESNRERVWLGRIAANLVARLDRESGGESRITVTSFRRCRICGRSLLGEEAEARVELDLRFEGNRIPCGPDCVELERAQRGRRGTQGKGAGPWQK